MARGQCELNNRVIKFSYKATIIFSFLLLSFSFSSCYSLMRTPGHVLELAEQSENKTLGVFSTVFSRMAPLSRKLIHQLYTEIIK